MRGTASHGFTLLIINEHHSEGASATFEGHPRSPNSGGEDKKNSFLFNTTMKAGEK